MKKRVETNNIQESLDILMDCTQIEMGRDNWDLEFPIPLDEDSMTGIKHSVKVYEDSIKQDTPYAHAFHAISIGLQALIMVEGAGYDVATIISDIANSSYNRSFNKLSTEEYSVGFVTDVLKELNE